MTSDEHEIVAFPSGGGESYYVKYAAIPRPELPLGTPILIRGYLVDTIEGRPVVGLVGHGMYYAMHDEGVYYEKKEDQA